MPEDELWECYPKGRGTECHRRRKPNYVTPYMKNERIVLFGNDRGDLPQVSPPADWRGYESNLHYGTHDLLADIALSVHNNNHQLILSDGEKFWTEKRRKIFLYATEAPDRPKTQYKGIQMGYKKVPNYIRFSIRNEELCEPGEAEDVFMRKYHLLQFNDQGNIKKEINWFSVPLETFLQISFEQNAAVRAQFWYEKGLDLFNEKKEYDGAAFCFGIMAHYIGDVACFYHVIDPYKEHIHNIEFRNTTPDSIYHSFMLHHSIFEKQILLRTDSIDQNGHYSPEKTIRSKFFNFNEEQLRMLTVNEYKDAKTATEKVAKNTAFGNPSARDLYSNYAEYFDDYEEILTKDTTSEEDGWPLNHYGNKELDWHYDPTMDGQLKKFLIRNEQILNYAISQISCVLNRIRFEVTSKY